MPHDVIPIFPFLIPIAGMAMVVAIIGIVFWYKAREKELQFHQDLRLREMEHQKRMKEIELEIEKLKAAGGTPKTSG
jgi:type II secretory pathway component PulM